MVRSYSFFAVMWLAAVGGWGASAHGQFGGSRAGGEGAPVSDDLPALSRESVESFIAIDGRAEVRVAPTELRVVLAVTGEGDNPADCRKQVDVTIAGLRKAWDGLESPPQQVVIDFIAVLPKYEWNLEKRGDAEVAVEQRAGYRMQTNVHLACETDLQAHAALNEAFELGVSDIIAFDYWAKDLDAIKVKAREQAVQAAITKSDFLLKTVFDDKPKPINLQEQTRVHFPDSLYHSFTNSTGEGVTQPPRRDLTLIGAHRPRNTYYRGLFSNGDVQARDLPMKPEISVVSTVRLYFQSPASADREPTKPKPQPLTDECRRS